MKSIIYIIIFVCLISIVSAVTLTRDMPDTVQTGNTFTVTYTVDPTGLTENWGILYTDAIIGDCYFVDWEGNKNTYRSSGWLSAAESPKLTSQTTVEAGPTGTCTFSGTYHFADAVTTMEGIIGGSNSIDVVSISIGGGGGSGGGGGTRRTCEPDWSCTDWSECIEGEQTRICEDNRNCGDIDSRPLTTRICEITNITCMPHIQDAVDGECKFNQNAVILLIIIIVVGYIIKTKKGKKTK